jgi:hypothetical protein
MSLQDGPVPGAPAGTRAGTAFDPDVAEVRRALVGLSDAVGRLQTRHRETLGVRRLASDVRRLMDDLEEIGELPPAGGTPTGTAPLHYVPDTPYPPDLWTGADDEGLDGAR